MKHYVGNMVTPKDKEPYVLTVGCNRDTRVIVTSVDPFVVVSEEGDRLWRNMDPTNFEYAGVATAKTLKTCIDRMNKDLRQDNINEHNANLTKELFKRANEGVDLDGFSKAVELLIANRE